MLLDLEHYFVILTFPRQATVQLHCHSFLKYHFLNIFPIYRYHYFLHLSLSWIPLHCHPYLPKVPLHYNTVLSYCRYHYINISLFLRYHYIVYYALYLHENSWASLPPVDPGVVRQSHSGQQSITRFISRSSDVCLTHEQMRIINHNIQENHVRVYFLSSNG